MKETVDRIHTELAQSLENAQTSQDVEALKVNYLGRKGELQELMKGLKDLSADERPEAGRMINELKQSISHKLDDTLKALRLAEQNKRLSEENIDVTLPGRRRFHGNTHVLLRTLDRIVETLSDMGFSVATGPHIDSDYNNFEALNFAKDHPARDMQDTFYITEDLLLRTHMTDLQVHMMEKHEPPLRIQAPGICYRNEEVTGRSHVFFHQVDVFYVDKGVTFGDLLATKEEFLRKLLPEGTDWRFRPSYFPFVEPGLEVDISCLNCKGKGCHICKHTGWLEIAGAGMIHPEVFKNVGIDPEVYSGYAWGMGPGRLTMLLHEIDDIRLFSQNDMRFLAQF